jgi:hypothetical protein
MGPLIQTAATALSVSPIDVYVIVAVLVLWIVFLVMGIQRTYEAYFGLVVGLAIYLMLTVLLSPMYQTPETAKIISPGTSKFLIGSSTYLIFILFILTPIAGGIPFPETKLKFVKYLELAAVAAFVWVFFFALLLGFASKTYIFNVDTAFVGIAKLGFYQELLAGKIFSKISMYLQPIVLLGVLFLIYKALLSELIGVILASVWKWLMSLRNKGKKDDGKAAAGGHDEHAAGGHDDHGGGGHDEHAAA